MYLNFFSIKTVVSRFQIVATGAKILAMVLVICTGFYFLIFKGNYILKDDSEWLRNLRFPGETQHFENMFENSTYAPGKLVSAMFAGLFSYDGWDILNYGTEEIENPRRYCNWEKFHAAPRGLREPPKIMLSCDPNNRLWRIFLAGWYPILINFLDPMDGPPKQ